MPAAFLTKFSTRFALKKDLSGTLFIEQLSVSKLLRKVFKHFTSSKELLQYEN